MNGVTYYLFLIVSALIILRSLYDFSMFVLAVTWLKRNLNVSKKQEGPQFIVVITVLWEQHTLRATVESLLRSSYNADGLRVVIVTTEKEFIKSFPISVSSTVDLAKQLQEQHPYRVFHLHYPKCVGAKAEQMNYAIDWILTDTTQNDRDVFVAFYDADSRPHPETFQVVAGLSLDRNQRVFQQSSIFFQNFKELREEQGAISGSVLQANAILQTRWTLTHEIPRILRQSYALHHWHRRMFLSHCVGHGLFLRKDLLREVRRMPTKTMTEDLFLGFVLSLRSEPIQAIPVLESADMPRSISAAARQKYVWYFGPLDHLAYARHVLQDKLCSAPTWLTFSFALRGLVPALAWLLSGWMSLFVIIYALASLQLWTLVISAGVLAFYLSTFVVTAGLHVWLHKFTGQQSSIRPIECAWAMAFLLPTLVLHSIPPIFSLVVKLWSVVTGIKPHKPKTEE